LEEEDYSTEGDCWRTSNSEEGDYWTEGDCCKEKRVFLVFIMFLFFILFRIIVFGNILLTIYIVRT
jgi:hypothetical protein